MKQKKKLKTSDFNRVLLSETIPSDIPLIFTNNWFYRHACTISSKKDSTLKCILSDLFEEKNIYNHTIPMRFRIRKDENSYREIGILHPRSQYKFIEFYKNFTNSIIHYCSKSKFSIRHPYKVSSSYYVANKYENAKKYKIDSCEKSSDETKFKHATSFFSYNSHTKLHNFFDSSDFVRLEKKYNEFWCADISKFFDSIYTHSIEWATKNKKHSKSTTGTIETFGAIFDKLMQSTNYNETSGIIIGNEISRIFSEIILQKTDNEISNSLSALGFQYEKDYEVIRYVDDYFIFSINDTVAGAILNEIQSELSKFRLHINQAKTIKQKRPFITGKSKSKLFVNEALEELFSLFFQDDGTFKLLNKKPIRKREKVVIKFLNKVKMACDSDSKAYSTMAGYIIGSILRRVTLISEIDTEISEADATHFRDASIIFLDIAFHFFGISPNTTNSNKISMTCYILFAFFDENIKSESKTIKLLISQFIKDFFESSSCLSLIGKDSYFSIELANLLYVSRNMGVDYLLSPKNVSSVFGIEHIDKDSKYFIDNECCSDYFRIVSTLYYIGNESEYNTIKQELCKAISKRLNHMNMIFENTKVMLLALDCIACPYIDEIDRKKWNKKLHTQLRNNKKIKSVEETELFEVISSNWWFISWDYPDLWNTLEKKQLILNY
ncbi:RNA-directed DNA polymerase [Shewanella sp. WXL01]|uniref:antiviral reverse transcriptase Drt3b n=1 Tax=Shewanella sp. WXL01 TaxID=2709721 RepID=UPI0014383BE9|nr:antiviral reverse transcriptase Drt3b [Shewanella sp. WXL01]NKF50191.1 RNA-directed DNA polymerase [Shewanella sp. WXL01]